MPNGTRLIKATPESAVFEINGQRRTITMGNQVSAAAPSSGSGQVILTADERGHFVTTGTINGANGAVPGGHGRDHDLDGRGATPGASASTTSQGQRGMSSTANGVARVYKVKLDTVRIGDITLNNVDALVHDQDMPWVLLGMSFLNRVEMRREGSNLTLIKRY